MTTPDVEFFMDQMSSDEVTEYFYVENQREHNTLYVKTKTSPLRIDKPEMNFVIGCRLGSPSSLYSSSSPSTLSERRKFEDQASTSPDSDDTEDEMQWSSLDPSFTRVNIKVMDATGRSMSKQPSFKSPSLAHYFLTLNLTDDKDNNGMPNTSIYELQATSPIGSIISYRIVNGNNSPFYIENNVIELSKDALFSKFFRNSYLVNISAFRFLDLIY